MASPRSSDTADAPVPLTCSPRNVRAQILAGAAWLHGYDHTSCLYEAIHQAYPPSCDYVYLRSTNGVLACVA